MVTRIFTGLTYLFATERPLSTSCHQTSHCPGCRAVSGSFVLTAAYNPGGERGERATGRGMTQKWEPAGSDGGLIPHLWRSIRPSVSRSIRLNGPTSSLRSRPGNQQRSPKLELASQAKPLSGCVICEATQREKDSPLPLGTNAEHRDAPMGLRANRCQQDRATCPQLRCFDRMPTPVLRRETHGI